MTFQKGNKFRFKKGYIPWIKGKSNPSAKNNPQIFKKGHTPWNKDKKFPQFSGKNGHNWKGGKRKDYYGYIHILKSNHPFADKQGYIKQSRLVAEKYLGRYLTSKEVVHHINDNKSDDRPENLYLFSFQAAQTKYHGNQYLKKKPILKSNLIGKQ